MRYYIDPFGCVKNQVDAENLMAFLDHSGWTVSEPEEADLIIVNSCGFIESAKQESINAVLLWRKHYPGKKIILSGCLARRYGGELAEALPEADLLFENEDLSALPLAAAELFGLENNNRKSRFRISETGKRPLLSLPGSAYVKISDGCDNRCSFCAIPLIRGGLASRAASDVINECKTLLDRGIKELCIIAQDIASYGKDIGDAAGLAGLLEALANINGDFWVRLLYIHPDNFPIRILETMKADTRFLPYFDLPFQHGSEKILRLMNRRGNARTYLALVKTIRGALPDAVIRSTFLTGFPGETEDDFRELLDFQEKARLDWAGCFAYSREEDTPAFSMKGRPSKKVAAERKKIIEEKQTGITEKQMDRFVGREFSVLVEEKIEGEEGLWLGRLPFQAPEVDGSAVITSSVRLVPGSIVRGRVFARAGFDLEVAVK